VVVSDLLSELGRQTRAAAAERHLRLQAALATFSIDLRRVEAEAESAIQIASSRRDVLADRLWSAPDCDLQGLRGMVGMMLCAASEAILAARTTLANVTRERADLAAIEAAAVPTLIGDLLLHAGECSGPPHGAPHVATTTYSN
jgi:hypothetical protein